MSLFSLFLSPPSVTYIPPLISPPCSLLLSCLQSLSRSLSFCSSLPPSFTSLFNPIPHPSPPPPSLPPPVSQHSKCWLEYYSWVKPAATVTTEKTPRQRPIKILLKRARLTLVSPATSLHSLNRQLCSHRELVHVEPNQMLESSARCLKWNATRSLAIA